MWMLLGIKTILKSVILPPTGSLLLAMLGVILIKRRPRLARACLILGVGSLWLLSTPLVSEALEGLAESFPPLNLQSAAGAQAVVILGGGGQREFAPEYAGPAAEPVLLERVAYGAYIARKTGLPVLLTGFHIEAAAMRATLLRNFEIEPRWVDDQAYDTFENARNSIRLLAPSAVKRIVLVTHATHMRRAAHEFTDAGVEVVAAPVGMRARRTWGMSRYFPDSQALLHSYFAIYEMLGEPVRALLVASHLRRHEGRPSP
jgi:uncharacterized SAM-binding protein YcdF (DUF218 family)